MKNIMRLFSITATIIAAIGLAACETEPRWNGQLVRAYSDGGKQYIKAPWARMDIDEAVQRCYQEIWSNPTLMVSHYMCMKAKGFQEQ